MQLIFSNPARDAVATFIAERLRLAIADIDSMRGEKTLFFTAKPVEQAEGLDIPPMCLAVFTLIDPDSDRRPKLVPQSQATTCVDSLYYSFADSSFEYPSLHIIATSLDQYCSLMAQRLIEAFTAED
jgi:hypothetical protein